MHVFIAIMAWGGLMPGRAAFRVAVNEKPEMIEALVSKVRQGMPRAAAYDLWRGEVPGLGPSFLTKVLAFTCPVGSMVIMDQWTVKAVNLLYGSEIVRLNRPRDEKNVTSPSTGCTGRDYERYCLHLEDLQRRLGEPTLSATEERIFSRHGDRWRSHVNLHWQPPPPRRARVKAVEI